MTNTYKYIVTTIAVCFFTVIGMRAQNYIVQGKDGTRSYYHMNETRSITLYGFNSESKSATIILTAGNIWGDDSGYQMLLDADATAFGTIIPSGGPLTDSGDADASLYNQFEYKIPENADGALNTSNIVIDNSVTITIPAGTYDWCITNPAPGDRMWIASGNGNVAARQDDYEFEAGKVYEFTISRYEKGDGVNVAVTNTIENGICINRSDGTCIKMPAESIDYVAMLDAQPVTCPDDHHPHIIDLGLSTKWACCNVDAHAPEEYGGYYAWGEIEEKAVNNWSTYTHTDGSSKTCNLGSDIAGTQYDVAHVKWGGSWNMPTKDQVTELLDNCETEWTTMNGVKGRKFTGPNGNSIFLPAAGYHPESSVIQEGGGSGIWTSTFVGNSYYGRAYTLSFGPDYAKCDQWASLCHGNTIRPVRVQGAQRVTSITLDETSLTLQKGGTHSFIATILPEDADNKAVTWESSDESVATVDQTGMVTAIAAGHSCIITCFATDGSGVYAECQVKVTDAGGTAYLTCPDDNHPHIIDLGLSTKWACCNVGANKPEEYGGYYAWGETEPKEEYNWSNYNGISDALTELPPQNDAATANWGEGWKMPTVKQMNELVNNCSR